MPGDRQAGISGSADAGPAIKLSRRTALLAALGLAVPPTRARAAEFEKFDTVTTGLEFPEGPMLASDGAIILSEVVGRRVTRVEPDGTRSLVANITDGMPVGLAAGPDEAIYVTVAKDEAKPGSRGRIQRIDPRTREVTDVLKSSSDVPLLIPDDLVFDAVGGFYFTDLSTLNRTVRSIDQTGIFYYDGNRARLVSDWSVPTNGIDLSPDGKRLYWTEYVTGRLFVRNVVAPGVLAKPAEPYADCLFIHPTPVTLFDSLRVDAEGCISVAVSNGMPGGKSGIMSFNPAGTPIGFTPMPDPVTTSLVLNWQGPGRAYVTLSGAGKLISLPWPRLGKRPYFFPSSLFR